MHGFNLDKNIDVRFVEHSSGFYGYADLDKWR